MEERGREERRRGKRGDEREREERGICLLACLMLASDANQSSAVLRPVAPPTSCPQVVLHHLLRLWSSFSPDGRPSSARLTFDLRSHPNGRFFPVERLQGRVRGRGFTPVVSCRAETDAAAPQETRLVEETRRQTSCWRPDWTRVDRRPPLLRERRGTSVLAGRCRRWGWTSR